MDSLATIDGMPALIVVGSIILIVIIGKIHRVYTNPISKLYVSNFFTPRSKEDAGVIESYQAPTLTSYRPGDEFSKWSGYRWWRTLTASNRISFQHSAHRKYGSVVRLSPTDVAVSDPMAIKQIFAVGSGFLKSKWYLDFTSDRDGDGVFSTVTPHLHQQRRRLLAIPMSDTMLRSTFEPEVRRVSRFCVQRMQEASKAESAFDVLRWWFLMATDTIGELTFGDSFHMLEYGRENQYIRDLRYGAPIAALSSAFPILATLLQRLPLGRLPGIWGSRQRSFMWARQSIRRYHNIIDTDPSNSVKETLFTKIWKSHEAGSISDEALSVEARFYLIAGTDTTANTLTYLIYELTQYPDWQQKVIHEVASLPRGFTSKDALTLPSLHNAITETLRLHGPIQSTLPRVVPTSGMTAAGHFLPSGTTVHAQAYSLHRNETIFPESETWNPSRWEKTTRDMTDMFLAWGAGSRICMGKNLAMMEMALAVAEFFRAFPRGVRLATEKGASGAGMEHMELPIAGPKGNSCWVASL